MSLFKRKEKEKTAEKWILEGQSLHSMKRYDEAIVCYDKALELDQEDPDAIELKGYLLRDLQRPDEAITCFDKVLEINPEDSDIWASKGIAFLQLQKCDEAIVCFDEALELNPMHDKAWLNKGVSLFGLDKYDDAIACYDKALQIDPENSVYVSELKEMVLRFQTENKVEEKTAEEWFQLGFDAEDLEKKVEYYTKALELDPEDSIMWYNRGNALRDLDQHDDAIQCYDKALDLNSDNDSAWYNKGTILANKLGRLDEAITCFDKVLELDPKDASAWDKKAHALSLLERCDEAIICYDKSLQFDPDNTAVWNNKGCDLKNLGRLDEAIICFDKSLELDPNDAYARNNRERSARKLRKGYTNEKKLERKTAYEWFQLGHEAEDPETQVECFTKALELDPENEYAWTLKGSSHIALENYDEAIECFNEALQINPKNLDDTILTKLGCTFGGFGEKEKAIWCFTKAIAINSHNDDSWFWKGYVYAQLEKYDEAFECFDNTIKINEQNDEAWYYKGYVLEEVGELDQAIDCYNQSIEINPKDADIWAKKANALQKLGKLDDALECMEKANELKDDKSNEQRTEDEKIKKQISPINSEINRLTKDRAKKFSEAGELAYSKCMENTPELSSFANKVETKTAESKLNIENSKLLHTQSDKELEYLKKGIEFAELKEYEKSIKCLDEAIALNPKNVESWVLKAFIFGNIEEHEKSIGCWDEAIALNPENAQSWYYKGISLSSMLKYSVALECFDKVIEIDPTYENVQEYKVESNRNLTAAEALKSNNTENGLYWYAVGEKRLEEIGFDIDTIEAFENALKFGGLTVFEEARSNALLGLIYRNRKSDVEATFYLKYALELNNKNNGILANFDDELYADVCLKSDNVVDNVDEKIRLLETPMKLNLELKYRDWDFFHLGTLYLKSSDECNDLDDKIYKLEKSIDYIKKAHSIDSGNIPETWKRQHINDCRNKIDKLKHPEIEIRNNPDKLKEVQIKISTLNSEINRHIKDRAEKFSDAGELAYSECIENAPELAPDIQTKLDDILATDTLISKTNQEMDKAKSGKKKSGFFAKFGDAVSSTAKQGKLKVELYNFERKKNSAITDFGEALYESYKIRDDTFQELSDIWQAIGDIEQQIHKNEEEIDNLKELL